MGWTYGKRPAGTPIECIKQLCQPPAFLAESKAEIVAEAQGGDAVFLAIKYAEPEELTKFYEPDEAGAVTTAGVYLYEDGGAQFGWKSIGEFLGPYNESKAPPEFIAKLSPIKEDAPGFAAQWRARQAA